MLKNSICFRMHLVDKGAATHLAPLLNPPLGTAYKHLF